MIAALTLSLMSPATFADEVQQTPQDEVVAQEQIVVEIEANIPLPPDLSGFTTTSAPTGLGKKIIADAKRQGVDDVVYVSFTVSGANCAIRTAEDTLGVVYLDVSGRTVDKATVYDGKTGGIIEGLRADDIKRKVAAYDASHTDSTDSTG